MTKEFYTKHKNVIESAIKNATVSYNMNSSKTGNVSLHRYDVSTKLVSVTAYAIKHSKKHGVSKYILKITVAYDTNDKKEFAVAKDTDIFASSFYHKLSAKHENQIARTQLKKNFQNRAFIRKR